MRSAVFTAFAAAALLACAGNSEEGEQSADAQTAPAGESDPTNEVQGNGLPAGWHVRFDRAGSAPTAVKFAAMGDGFHVTSGPAALYWHDSMTVQDGANYRISADFAQSSAPAHPEAYGLFAGAKDVEAPGGNYVYVIVRGDGKYSVKHRANDTEIHTVKDWTDSPALKKQDADGKATNSVAIDVAADSIRALVNGTQVWSAARSYMGGMGGNYGYRVNHNLDVHLTPITLTKR
jgi:hypothetical protein